MKGEEMQKVFFDAGLRVTEAADLLRVSRHALYDWFKGTPARNKFTFDTAIKITKLIGIATKMGHLPLPPRTRKAERMGLIKTALKKAYRPEG